MTVRARTRLPSATVYTQHTAARTAAVVRRMRVSVLPLRRVEGWAGSLGPGRHLFAIALPSLGPLS